MTLFDGLSPLFCQTVASFLIPRHRLALCTTSKGIETLFLVTVGHLPLGTRRAFSRSTDADSSHSSSAIPASPNYLLHKLLSRVGPFVRLISLHCTERALKDGILNVLDGPHRDNVALIMTRRTMVSGTLLTPLVNTLRQQGMAKLAFLYVDYSFVVEPNGDDEALSSSLAAAALQYCPYLLNICVRDVFGYHTRPFDLMPLATAMNLRCAGGNALPLHSLCLEYSGKSSSAHRLREMLLSEACGSLAELVLTAGWHANDESIIDSVGAFLRETGAPSLYRLLLSNYFGRPSENIEIALALQKGSAPQLESLQLKHVIQDNSMSILAEAVVQDGRFAGLHELGFLNPLLDPSSLFQAIATTDKCPHLRTLDATTTVSRSMVALRDAHFFCVGAHTISSHPPT